MRAKRLPFFSFYGRVGRLQFAILQLIILVFDGFGGIVLPLTFGPDEDRLAALKTIQLSDTLSFVVVGLVIVLIVVFGVMALSFEVRRFHDFGFTGWAIVLFAVLKVIPFPETPIWAPDIADVIWGAILIAIPGTRGRNKYGPDPRARDTDDVTSVFGGPPEAATRVD